MNFFSISGRSRPPGHILFVPLPQNRAQSSAMKTRREIVANWLPRYTGVPLNKFGGYVLLTNFDGYVQLFAQWHRVPVMGKDKPMTSATAGDITIIIFGMGSATAATVMDLLASTAV